MTVLIIGAGAVGRTAKLFFPDAVIVDQQAQPRELSRNFGTQYLWEPLPGVLCYPFEVETRIDGKLPTPELAALYKHKIGKPSDVTRPSLMAQFQERQQAYRVAPGHWPHVGNVLWGRELVSLDPLRRIATFRNKQDYEECIEYSTLISTIPFFILFKLLTNIGVPHAEDPFEYRPIYVTRERRPNLSWEVMQVNYITDPNDDVYRTCEWGEYFQLESLEIPPEDLPPQFSTHVLFPGKIWPNEVVEPVVGQLMIKNVHCVGRYGRWEPDELLHETVRRIARIPGARSLMVKVEI